jgi:adenylosuccinate synthase
LAAINGGIEHYDDLPSKARIYLDRIAELLGTDIAIISTGPKRSQTIINKEHETFLRLKRHL